MYKLLHIHTDSKFTHDTLKYVDDRIYNEIIFIGDVNETGKLKLENTKIPFKIYNSKNELIEIIIKKSNDFDGIVLNELCSFKGKLIDKLPKSKVIYLRLFGYELYSVKIKKFVSELTFKELQKDKNSKTSKSNWKKKLKEIFRLNNFLEERGLIRRLERINAILLVNEYEYAHLSKFYNLPSFIQIPLHEKVVKTLYEKKNNIIVGNSKAYWNNHLDVLKIIEKHATNQFDFELFFSYGPENSYVKKVREKASVLNNVYLIENFLAIEDFREKYNNASALVVNSYRQHALANIIFAILYGLKVYLNKKSSTYHWLKNNNFIISEIEDLKTDLENDKLKLSYKQQQSNIDAYSKLQDQYTTLDFVDKILSLKNER